jgi:iron(II)-dependent oxidoreductase
VPATGAAAAAGTAATAEAPIAWPRSLDVAGDGRTPEDLVPALEAFKAIRGCTLACEAMISDRGLVTLPRIWHWSPLGWQYGHVSCFEEQFVLVRLKGDKTINEAYLDRFMPATTPPPERIHLPGRAEILAYLHEVRERSVGYFEAAGATRDVRFTVEMLVEHEAMHLEHQLHMCAWLPPEELISRPDALPTGASWRSPGPGPDMLGVAGGRVRIGGTPGRVWDNELPPFELDLPPFAIGRLPVSNRDYLGFLESDGYTDRRWWCDAGWAWLEFTGALHPCYWRKEGDFWRQRDLFEEPELRLDEPVLGLSWYEADAFARFAGKRLPTEFEWEHAAKTLGGLPGAGHAWEWTASWFKPYAGFEVGPYRRYSEPQFGEVYKVLKGGCWATIPAQRRASFRNWYNPSLRQIFAGLRLAE